jgi:serine/threonine protein kinase
MKIVDIVSLYERFLSAQIPVDYNVLSQKVEDEIHILTLLLGHPNIVELHQGFRIGCSVFICLEYFPGVDLLQFIPRGGLCEDEARMLFRQLMEAVYFCRTRNVIHGDIKVRQKNPRSLAISLC